MSNLQDAMTNLPESADTLEDARTLALSYQSIAVEQGSKIIRLRIALQIIREFGMDIGFHGGVMFTIREWIDAGMDGPVPWPESVFFDTWAKSQGMSKIDGAVGFRLTVKMKQSHTATRDPPESNQGKDAS